MSPDPDQYQEIFPTSGSSQCTGQAMAVYHGERYNRGRYSTVWIPEKGPLSVSVHECVQCWGVRKGLPEKVVTGPSLGHWAAAVPTKE